MDGRRDANSKTVGFPQQQPSRFRPPNALPTGRTLTITLNGESYDVSSENALRWVKVLVDHAGDWIPSSVLKTYDPDLDGCRPDHLKKHLPKAILDLIHSKPGAGSRLRI